jgi:hypothetical protein
MPIGGSFAQSGVCSTVRHQVPGAIKSSVPARFFEEEIVTPIWTRKIARSYGEEMLDVAAI